MKQRLQQRRILWFGLFGSVPIYVGIGFFVGRDLEPAPIGALFFAAIAIAISGLFGSVIVGRRMSALVLKRCEFPVRDVLDEEAERLFRDTAPTRRVIELDDAMLNRAMLVHTIPFILTLAMTELTPVMGVLLAVMGTPITVWLPFMVVGGIAMAARFPTRAKLESAIASAYDAAVVSAG